MFSFLKNVIVTAGEICVREQQLFTRSEVDFKGRKDLVTVVDKKVEHFIVEQIQTTWPSHGIFGEETGRTNLSSDYLWIIDPIDGTTSYVHQQPFYSVSIALQHLGKTICGAVYLPALNELFFADSTSGAFLNQQSIKVSSTDLLVNSVMATGFACLRAGREHNNLHYLGTILPDLRDIRRCGSAAMDLCYVACGRFDGFWEMALNLYDVAAGAFIVQQAGGIVTDFHGSNTFPDNGIIASNPALHHKLLPYFTEKKS